MRIDLTKKQIDAALPKVAVGLAKYQFLQDKVAKIADFATATDFQTKFNGFYRIRRDADWRHAFYRLMTKAKAGKYSLRKIVETILRETGRYEASFASKLYATFDPTAPVIDSVALKNMGGKLPRATCPDRLLGIEQVHADMRQCVVDFLRTALGRYLVDQFKQAYPHAHITEEKMVDLVLWQTRALH